jgi:hypothetical protein
LAKLIGRVRRPRPLLVKGHARQAEARLAVRPSLIEIVVAASGQLLSYRSMRTSFLSARVS